MYCLSKTHLGVVKLLCIYVVFGFFLVLQYLALFRVCIWVFLLMTT